MSLNIKLVKKFVPAYGLNIGRGDIKSKRDKIIISTPFIYDTDRVRSRNIAKCAKSLGEV